MRFNCARPFTQSHCTNTQRRLCSCVLFTPLNIWAELSLNRPFKSHTACSWTMSVQCFPTPQMAAALFSLQFLRFLTRVFSLAVRLYPAPKPICSRRVPERLDYLAPPAVFVEVTLSWWLLHWFEVFTITCRFPYKTCTSSGSIHSLQAGR